MTKVEKAKALQKFLNSRGIFYVAVHSVAKHDDMRSWCQIDLLDDTISSYGAFTLEDAAAHKPYSANLLLRNDLVLDMTPHARLSMRICTAFVDVFDKIGIRAATRLLGSADRKTPYYSIFLQDREEHIAIDKIVWEKLAIEADLAWTR